MKIIDAFTFYNELDLLLYRLTLLDDVVDHFIIVEATKTYVGNNKELFFEKNKHLYEKFLPKIVHVIDDDLIVPDITTHQQWQNEIHQRDSIYKGLELLSLNPDDYIFITDLDEIPDPQQILQLKNNNINHNYAALKMNMYYYNLNCKCIHDWYHAKVVKYDIFAKNPDITCNKIRMNKPSSYIDKGGWHLSYFGDGEFIKNKIENFSHQEYNTEKYTNVNSIHQCIENYNFIFETNNKCFIQIPIAKNNYLPPLYNTLLTKFIKC